MKITICGSLVFMDDMIDYKRRLEELGHKVVTPPLFAIDTKGGEISAQNRYDVSKRSSEDDTWVWDMREQAMKSYFEKVAHSDTILIINKEKNNIPGYIGANTLMEMGVAFHLNKPIYIINPIPEISYKEEILGMKPILIEGDLSKI